MYETFLHIKRHLRTRNGKSLKVQMTMFVTKGN